MKGRGNKGAVNMKSVHLITACLVMTALSSGCSSGSGGGRRMARYRPNVDNRSPWLWEGGSDHDAGSERQPSRPRDRSQPKTIKRGDGVVIYLRGIRVPEDVDEVVDELGNINLPLIGTVPIEGKTTSEAENLIEKKYVTGGFYRKINIIIVSQPGQYFMRGEIKGAGKYRLTGDLTLLQAIASAKGYTDYANRRKIEILRKGRKLIFNTVKIEDGKEKDPFIQAEDIIVIRRKLW